MSDYILGFNDVSDHAQMSLKPFYHLPIDWDNYRNARLLKNDYLNARAKTTNTNDFVIDITLPESLFPEIPLIEVLGLCHHNLSPDAAYIWQSFTDAERTEINNESSNYILYDFIPGINKTCCDVIDNAVISRHWSLIISDPDNPDGCIKIGKLFLGQRFRPGENMQYGVNFAINTDSTFSDTLDNGTENINKTIQTREITFSHALMSDTIAANWQALQQQAGRNNNLLFEFNPDDKMHGIKTFLARNESMNPLDHSNYNTNQFAFKIKETI